MILSKNISYSNSISSKLIHIYPRLRDRDRERIFPREHSSVLFFPSKDSTECSLIFSLEYDKK